MKATPYLKTEMIQLRDLELSAEIGELFAVIDACDAREVPYQVIEWGEEKAVSLYRGNEELDFADFAPYLVHVDKGILEWIITQVWEEPWGIFVVCSQNLPTLRQHFRKFLIVQDPDGEEMYFRFYDPRVLRKFLPTCNAGELRFLFGPIKSYCFNIPETLEEEAAVWQVNERMAHEATLPIEAKSKGFKMPIRPPQMAVFEDEAIRILAYEIEQHLKESHKKTVHEIPEDILHQMIMSGIKRADQYELNTQSSVTAFVAIMFEVAPNFDEQPRFKAVLNDKRLDPDARMQQLIQPIYEQDWEKASQNYNDNAWETES